MYIITQFLESYPSIISYIFNKMKSFALFKSTCDKKIFQRSLKNARYDVQCMNSFFFIIVTHHLYFICVEMSSLLTPVKNLYLVYS